MAKVNFQDLPGLDAKNVPRIPAVSPRAGQIFITFVRELIGRNEAIDAYRRHGVSSSFLRFAIGETIRDVDYRVGSFRRCIYERNKSPTVANDRACNEGNDVVH